MKHLTSVTQRKVSKADAAQDLICAVASVIAGLLGALGGASPVVGLIDDKCAFPTGDGGSNDA